MARRRSNPISSDVQSAIAAASQRWGIPPEVLRAYARVESSFNPRAQTGSYSGLFQLSPEEFRRGGGQGSIYDPHQNAAAAGRLLAGHKQELEKRLGREANWNEVYLAHQQGMGGVTAHLENPSKLAWENMASTAEGRRKDARGPIYELPDGSKGLWSQAAVARNIPPASGLDWRTATSADFTRGWGARLERAGVPGGDSAPTSLAGIPGFGDQGAATPDPQPNPPDQPRDLSALSAAELTRMAGPKESPYEMAGGTVPSLSDVAASTPPPVVPSTEPTGSIGSLFGAGSAPNLGRALSAAGKAIAASAQSIPSMDVSKAMQALGPAQKWPTIQDRPRRQFGPRTG